MEKKQKVIQIYAIIICIIAVITIIISVTSLVSAIIDQGDPLYAGRYEMKLASFENFKMDALKSTQKDQAYIPDDQTLQKMFEAAKNDKIRLVQHQSYRTIIVSSLIIAISSVLFGVHWWLMRKAGKEKQKKLE